MNSMAADTPTVDFAGAFWHGLTQIPLDLWLKFGLFCLWLVGLSLMFGDAPQSWHRRRRG